MHKIVKSPFFYTQLLLGTFLVCFLALRGLFPNTLVWACGAASVATFVVESKHMPFWRNPFGYFKPLIPWVLLVLLSVILLPLIPYAYPRVRTNFTGLVIFLMVFSMYRHCGRVVLLEWAFAAIVLSFAARFVFFPGSIIDASDAGLSISFQEADAYQERRGLGANNMIVMVSVAILLWVRRFFYGAFYRKKFEGLNFVIAIMVVVLGAWMFVYHSGSRQGLFWLFFASILIVVSIGYRRLVMSLAGGFFISIVLFALGFFLFRDLAVFERIFQTIDHRHTALVGYEGSFNARWMMYQDAFRIWLTSPIWGVGNEGFRVYGSFGGTYSHSNYMELLVSYGLLGFLLFYLPLWMVFYKSLKMIIRFKTGVRVDYLWIVVSLLAFFVSNLFIPAIFERPFLVLIGAIIGVFYFHEDQQRCFLKRSSVVAPADSLRHHRQGRRLFPSSVLVRRTP